MHPTLVAQAVFTTVLYFHLSRTTMCFLKSWSFPPQKKARSWMRNYWASLNFKLEVDPFGHHICQVLILYKYSLQVENALKHKGDSSGGLRQCLTVNSLTSLTLANFVLLHWGSPWQHSRSRIDYCSVLVGTELEVGPLYPPLLDFLLQICTTLQTWAGLWCSAHGNSCIRLASLWDMHYATKHLGYLQSKALAIENSLWHFVSLIRGKKPFEFKWLIFMTFSS